MKAHKFISVLIYAAFATALVPSIVRAQSVYQPYYYSDYFPYQQAHPMSAVSNMDTYSYDANLDPKNPPYVTPKAHDPSPDRAGGIGLNTMQGLDVGLQISGYDYREPSLGVEISGPKFGLVADATGNLGDGYFIGADLRYALGDSQYQGSGTSDNNFEDLFDMRALFGKDFIFTRWALSPYLGIGYRHFYSDERGASSTGASGYRRINNLFYVPLGITPRFRVTDTSRISTTLEYDALISGNQKSMLSDVDSGYPDLTNDQTSGYGLRASVMWEHQTWSIGPFLTYWSISQSDAVCASGSAYSICGYEPANHTFEGGAQFKYHFF